MVKSLTVISKEKFAAFIKVRDSGKTNMFDSAAVMRLSGYVLDRDDVITIISNFDTLAENYPNVDKRK